MAYAHGASTTVVPPPRMAQIWKISLPVDSLRCFINALLRFRTLRCFINIPRKLPSRLPRWPRFGRDHSWSIPRQWRSKLAEVEPNLTYLGPILADSGQCWPNPAHFLLFFADVKQHRAELGRIRANFGQFSHNLGLYWPNPGQFGRLQPNLAVSVQLLPIPGRIRSNLARIRPNSAKFCRCRDRLADVRRPGPDVGVGPDSTEFERFWPHFASPRIRETFRIRPNSSGFGLMSIQSATLQPNLRNFDRI